MNFMDEIKTKDWITISLGVFLFIATFACFNFWGLYEKIALSGFSPIHYTDLKLIPENFVSNFRSGVEAYDNSLLMAIYPLLKKYIGISPEFTLKGMMVFEYFALFLISFFLIKELRPRSGFLEVFALWFVFSSSYGLDTNLANFGLSPQGQFYIFAYFFAIIGTLLCLKDRFISAMLCFMIAMLTHSIIGAMAIFLALFTFVPSPKIFFQKHIFIPFFSLGIGVMVWISWLLLHSTTSSGAIPQDLWVSLTRMGSFHWYPYHLGLLTDDPWRFFIPFLCFLLLLTQYFPSQKEMMKKDKKVLLILLGALVLSIVGILISIFFPSPFLIKLALHRASIFLLFFGWVYLVSGLFQDIKQGTILEKSMALTTFLLPFLQRYSIFMLIPTLLLARSTIEESFKHPSYSSLRTWIVWLTLGTILFLLGLKGYSGFSELKVVFIKAVGIRWWNYFFFIFAVFLVLDFLEKKNYVVFKKLTYLFPIAIILGGIWVFQWHRLFVGSELERGKDYLETQLWAKNYTPHNALFMVDPGIRYGWRDFSQRSSFGSSREWVHASWLYDSDEHVFREGLHRFSLLKLPIENYLTGFFPAIDGNSKLSFDVENAFYRFDERWFEDIQKVYGIHYIVMQREKITKQYEFPTVFENKHFVVFKLPELSNKTPIN
ncbi:MAG: hypothetical protein K2Y08_04860 [Alphaproteobacteria bacterium]|nr:hypothetical protein [Alphaproteobacteria bacterium]